MEEEVFHIGKTNVGHIEADGTFEQSPFQLLTQSVVGKVAVVGANINKEDERFFGIEPDSFGFVMFIDREDFTEKAGDYRLYLMMEQGGVEGFSFLEFDKYFTVVDEDRILDIELDLD